MKKEYSASVIVFLPKSEQIYHLLSQLFFKSLLEKLKQFLLLIKTLGGPDFSYLCNATLQASHISYARLKFIMRYSPCILYEIKPEVHSLHEICVYDIHCFTGTTLSQQIDSKYNIITCYCSFHYTIIKQVYLSRNDLALT